MKRKSGMFSALIVAVSLILSACSSQTTAPTGGETKSQNQQTDQPIKDDNKMANSSEKVTLTMWDNFTTPESSKVFETIIKNFNQQNPNIEVKRNVMQVEDIRKLIKPALTSKKGPDLFYYDTGPGYLGVLAKAGLALDLTPYTDMYKWKDRFPKWVQERATFNGKMYGIGNEVELLGVYYNKKIFQDLGVAVPKTYEEFLNICKLAKEKGLTAVSFDDKEQWPAFHLESIYYNANAGKDKINEVLEKKASWDQPEFAEGLDAFAKLIKDGYTTKNPLAISYDDGNKEFFSGKAAMRITGTWMVQGMYENLKDNVGFFILPPLKPQLPTIAPGGLGAAMVVSANTSYPKEATKFLDFMFSQETAKIWYEASYIPPLNINVNTLNVNPLFKEVVQMANNPNGMSFNVDVLMPQKVNDVTKNIMQELIAGKKTGADVVKAKQKAYEEEIKAGND